MGDHSLARRVCAAGVRLTWRNHIKPKATTDSSAIAGCNACSVVNCITSIEQPDFIVL